MFTRCSLKEELKTGIFDVEFMKVDGSMRTMTCTLKADLLPPPTEGKRKKADNENVLAVFDINKKDWRSFKIANVVSVREIKNDN